MKKKLTLILSLLVAMSIALPLAASAEETGSIELTTVPNNSFDGTTLNAYQIFHISGSEQTFWTYTIHEDFEDFEYDGLSGLGLINYIYSLEDDAAAHGPCVRSLTEALLTFIRENEVQRTGSVSLPYRSHWENPNITSMEISGLPPGYYLVTGNIRVSNYQLGAQRSISPFTVLAGTGSTGLALAPKVNTPHIFLDFAEGQPSLAGVGDEMSFIAETAVPLNVNSFESYFFQLNLTMGFYENAILRLVPGSLEVRVGSPEADPIPEQGSYSLTDFSLIESAWGNRVTVDFTQGFLEDNIGNKLYITFSAIRLESGANEHGNMAFWVNLNYSANDMAVGSVNDMVLLTNTVIHVFKFTGDLDTEYTPLGGETGVRFALSRYPDAQEGSEIDYNKMLLFIKDGDGKYTFALEQESPPDGGRVRHMAPSSFGFFRFIGLPTGTYYLYETSAPEGFSQLSAPLEVVIDSAEHWGGVFTPSANIRNNGFIDNEWIQYIMAVAIQNNRSTMFPETGGVGTGIFLLIGTIIMTISATAIIIYRKHRNRNNKQNKQIL